MLNKAKELIKSMFSKFRDDTKVSVEDLVKESKVKAQLKVVDEVYKVVSKNVSKKPKNRTGSTSKIKSTKKATMTKSKKPTTAKPKKAPTKIKK
jgi:small nuclear ribonucleoprotein (snRNP)-like protein